MNIKETDYCIMARLEISQSDKLEVSDKKHIAREYAQHAGENKFIKIYELNIHPTTDITVTGPAGFITEYKLYLYLINKNKKIIEVPESEIEVVRYVFNKLLEDDFDFNYENYAEAREKLLGGIIGEPLLGQPTLGANTWHTSGSLVGENWHTTENSGKDVADMLQKWADLCKGWTKTIDITDGRKEGASPYVVNSREILANDIYKNTYDVRFNYGDWSDKKD